MFNVILKTLILYVVIIFAMRLMGKKQAGQLQPYEFVITLLLAEVASTPMDSPGTPLTYGLVPLITLLLLYYGFSFLCNKSKKLRTLFCGKPSILIHNGKLLAKEIRKMGYSLNDLIEQLRLSGYTNISNIQYAVLETNGQLSVLPYAAYSPVTPNDLNIDVEEDVLYAALILDGELYTQGLEQLGYDKQSITKLLHTLGFSSLKEIFIMTLSDYGDVFIQDKQGNTKSIKLPRSAMANNKKK